MVNSIRTIQKDYENYLESLQTEKKNAKKFVSRIDTLAKKNAELGIEVNTEELKLENEIKLEQLDKDIVKVKKVIHRLGKCINIMLDGQIDTEHTDDLTHDERIALEIEGNQKMVEEYENEE